MKDCGRYERWTALAAGGDLPPRRLRKLEEHRAGCERCRELAAALTETRAEWQEAAEEPPDLAALAAVRSRVMARIAAERPVRRARLWWRVLAPAAAALAAVLLMIGLWSGGKPAGAPAPAVRRQPPPVVSAPPAVAARRAAPKPRRPRTPVAVQAVIPKNPDAPPLVKYRTPDPNVVVYWVTESAED